MKRRTVITKKRRGPLPTGKGMLIGVRLHSPQVIALKTWIAEQDDNPSRPEAIRRLVELGIASARPTPRRSKKAASKATELAAVAIDHLGDKSAPAEERQRRMLRLVKGPPEFRDVRTDLPKPTDEQS
jgi:hypothetical protein